MEVAVYPHFDYVVVIKDEKENLYMWLEHQYKGDAKYTFEIWQKQLPKKFVMALYHRIAEKSYEIIKEVVGE